MANPAPPVEAPRGTIGLVREQLAVKDRQRDRANVIIANLTGRPIGPAPIAPAPSTSPGRPVSTTAPPATSASVTEPPAVSGPPVAKPGGGGSGAG